MCRYATLILVALLLLPNAGRATPCGDELAPGCDGTCPTGQRCVRSDHFFDSETIVEGTLPARPRNPQAPDGRFGCECLSVLCGGEPLADNEGCCNGRRFTFGLQGCCAGVVQSVSEPCADCDLSVTGCCSLTIGESAAGFEFDLHNATCCQQHVMVGGFPGINVIEYAFSTGVDCCPSATTSTLCPGTCEGSTCIAGGCCSCTECLFTSQTCAESDRAENCFLACSASACQGFSDPFTQQSVCSGDGACVAAPSVPATSHTGLGVTIASLVLVAGFAIARRRGLISRARNSVR